MFRNIKISAKITGLIVMLSLLTVIAIGLFTYRYNLETTREKFNNNLNVVADNRADLINHYFDNAIHTVKFLQVSLLGVPQDSLGHRLQWIKDIYSFENVIVSDSKGTIVASGDTLPGVRSFQNPDGAFLENAAKGIHFSTVKKDSSGYAVYLGAPMGTHIVVAKLNLNQVYLFLEDLHGLGETGETFLAQQDPTSGKFLIVSPLRSDPGAFLKSLAPGGEATREIKLALEGKNNSGIGVDYRGKEVLAAWRIVPGPRWALVVKMDADEINGQGKALTEIYVFAGLAILLTAVALSMLFSRSLMLPLNSMRQTLERVSKGELPEKEDAHTNDEFGMMATKVDDLVQTLKNNAHFAQKVGEGKFDASFKPASENDTLGLSLINMRDNLVENERREKERTWIVRGVAEVGEILRAHDTLEELGNDVIKFIVSKIGAIQGAFYVVNDEEGKKSIELRNSFAYGRKKHLKKSFQFAEGLVGQAAIEQDTVLRTESPDDYVSITSGLLGEQKPTCILIPTKKSTVCWNLPASGNLILPR